MSVALADISMRVLESKADVMALGSPKSWHLVLPKDHSIWLNNRSKGSSLEVYELPYGKEDGPDMLVKMEMSHTRASI